MTYSGLFEEKKSLNEMQPKQDDTFFNWFQDPHDFKINSHLRQNAQFKHNKTFI